MVGDDDSGPAEPRMIGILSAESPPVLELPKSVLLIIRAENSVLVMLLYTIMLLVSSSLGSC